MICYQCGNQIKREFSKFCDHCGSNLEIKSKTFFAKKEIPTNMDAALNKAP
jgi:rRNA maturation endonuclease Nob1